MYSIDWAYIYAAIPDLLKGLGVTLVVSLLAIVFSLLLGLIGCAMRVSRYRPLRYIIIGYVEFIRGTPYLVQIFFIFYGLPSLGLQMSIFWSGVTALTVWASAFHIESFRAGYSAVSKDTHNASASLGFRDWHHVVLVVVPIALRSALPSTLNTVVGTIKNSAFLQAIGLVELTFVAVDRIAQDYRSIEMFLSICAIYLVVVLIASGVGALLERRLSRPYAGR